MTKTPEPSWTSLSKEGSIEIRHYDPMVVAEVTMTGERYKAINEGFRVLAAYIFGGNADKKEITMTAPVIQQKSDKQNEWNVVFVMPSTYTLATLPKTGDGRIRFVEVPAQKRAVITFSGLNTDKNLSSHYDVLKTWLANKKLAYVGEPVYAFYNPPWTPFFLKRNEIMVTLTE